MINTVLTEHYFLGYRCLTCGEMTSDSEPHFGVSLWQGIPYPCKNTGKTVVQIISASESIIDIWLEAVFS